MGIQLGTYRIYLGLGREVGLFLRSSPAFLGFFLNKFEEIGKGVIEIDKGFLEIGKGIEEILGEF